MKKRNFSTLRFLETKLVSEKLWSGTVSSRRRQEWELDSGKYSCRKVETLQTDSLISELSSNHICIRMESMDSVENSYEKAEILDFAFSRNETR